MALAPSVHILVRTIKLPFLFLDFCPYCGDFFLIRHHYIYINFTISDIKAAAPELPIQAEAFGVGSN